MVPDPDRHSLRLRLLLPVRTLRDEPVTRVVAEGLDGEFCLLPRHVDFVSALVPGILTYVPLEGGERHVAVNGGVLVKQGFEVGVSTEEAVAGVALERLRERVEREFLAVDEHERTARSVLARLEAGVLRRFIELQER